MPHLDIRHFTVSCGTLNCILAAIISMSCGCHKGSSPDGPIGMVAPQLQAGRFVKDFPGWLIYVQRRDGNTLHTISLYEWRDNFMTRAIFVDVATLQTNCPKGMVVIDMPSGVENSLNDGPQRTTSLCFSNVSLVLPCGVRRDD